MVSREEKSNRLQKQMMEEEKQAKKKKRTFRFIIFFVSFFLFIGSLLAYMRFIGTTGLQVREYKIVNSKLPESFHGFKIVHFSDLHYLSTIHKKDLQNLINTINRLKPDIVVFTGDLTDVDANFTTNDINDLVNLLNKIQVSTGLYAIKGNHDYQNHTFDTVFSQTKFKVLHNDYDLIYYHGSTPILITGVGSNLEQDMDIGTAYSYHEEDSLFTISLIHEPDELDTILMTNSIDLALSGHSHNGQVRLPFVGAIKKIDGSLKYPNEYYKVQDTDLYVSGGLGTSIFKLRFFNRPSINFYRLVEK